MGHPTRTQTGTLRGVVAVGASAGGVEALANFAAGLPADLPFAVLVVLHMPTGAPSVLAKILDRHGPLPAAPAVDHAPLEPGKIYTAVPDRHLLVDDHRVLLSDGPTENSYRPAINALFRSVALEYGPRAVGLLLSGVLDDGVLGAAAIRSQGGTAIAQSPRDALFATMPVNAIQAGVVDHEVTAKDAGRLLMQLAQRQIVDTQMDRDPNMALENRIAMGRRLSTSFDTEVLGPPSGYSCPDCHGSLQAVGDGSFRCHVGHAWTAESLLEARDDEVERALWIAIRSLQEKSKLVRRMADTVKTGALYEKFRTQAEEAERAVTVLGEHLAQSYHEAGELGVG